MPARASEAVTVPVHSPVGTLLKKYGTIAGAGTRAGDSCSEEGFPVTPSSPTNGRQATLLGGSAPRRQYMPNGHPLEQGEWFRNPTTRALHDILSGPRSLWRLTRRRSSRTQKLGGFLTLADFKANKPDWVTPISIMFKGYRIWDAPGNQGVGMLEMLKILEPYDLKAMGHSTPRTCTT